MPFHRRAQDRTVATFLETSRIHFDLNPPRSHAGRQRWFAAPHMRSLLIAGSLGTLGVIGEVTLKVLPRPVAEQTLSFEMTAAEAIGKLNQWGGQPLPLNVMARPALPGLDELQRLGVRRVSLGGSLARAAYGELLRAVARDPAPDLRTLRPLDVEAIVASVSSVARRPNRRLVISSNASSSTTRRAAT